MTTKLTITNLRQDTITFPEVKPPKGGKPFELRLGSQDDLNEEAQKAGILQPGQPVPEWAVDELKKLPYFQNLIDIKAIMITRPA